MDTLDDLFIRRPATARRPLLGVTVLVVEDSRFACEAVRLLCLRSGARIRRADSLTHAERHLKVYRPGVLIVDVGLPDGSGLNLIRDMAHTTDPVDVILGTSGDDTCEAEVMEAGANGFLRKPIASLAEFQSAVLEHMPADRQPPGPRALTDEIIVPDMIAYHDDLSHVASVLDGDQDPAAIDYITQFLSGVALSANDEDLREAVKAVSQQRTNGQSLQPQIAQLAAVVQSRLATASVM